MQAEAGLTSGAEAGVQQLAAEFSSEELRSLDSEGRAVVTRHRTSAGHLAVINVYCPRADAENTERVRFKQQFFKAEEVERYYCRCENVAVNSKDAQDNNSDDEAKDTIDDQMLKITKADKMSQQPRNEPLEHGGEPQSGRIQRSSQQSSGSRQTVDTVPTPTLMLRTENMERRT